MEAYFERCQGPQSWGELVRGRIGARKMQAPAGYAERQHPPLPRELPWKPSNDGLRHVGRLDLRYRQTLLEAQSFVQRVFIQPLELNQVFADARSPDNRS